MFVKRLMVGIILSLFLQVASADLTMARLHVDNASLVGEGRLRVLFFNVFDARLYAPNGHYDANAPFALSLSYLRRLEGDQIVAKTISELEAQGRIDKSLITQWGAELSRIIPDVDQNTTITGVRDSSGHTQFYRNDKFIGTIDDPRFTRGFFDIWLGESTSEPKLREQLLNRKST